MRDRHWPAALGDDESPPVGEQSRTTSAMPRMHRVRFHSVFVRGSAGSARRYNVRVIQFRVYCVHECVDGRAATYSR